MKPKRQNTIGLVLVTSAILITQSSAYAKGLYLVFPDTGSERDQLAFCVTVQEANHLAMDNAANRIEHLGKSKSQPAPNVILEKIGGNARYQRARAAAEQWAQNINSLSQTYYYPLLSGDGTPYVESAGKPLLASFMRCLAVFEQAVKKQ